MFKYGVKGTSVLNDEMCNSIEFNIDWNNVNDENISDFKVVLDSNLSQINIPWNAVKC